MYCASKAALHSVTETLSMELRPFNVQATLVIPGSIKSNISTNHQKDFLLPPNSLYKPYILKIVARMFASQEKGAMPADKFAEHVVRKVLGERPSLFVRGGQWAWRIWCMNWLPRTWVLSYLARRFMGARPPS